MFVGDCSDGIISLEINNFGHLLFFGIDIVIHTFASSIITEPL
jgi:hypothetical protein